MTAWHDKGPPRARVALVTGAANGIGRSVALRMLQRGHSVVAVDRDEAGLQRLATDSAGKANFLATLTADFADFDAEQLATDARARFGQVDILVNNAGVGQGLIRPDYHAHPPKFHEVTPAQWQRAISVNATAVFLLSREFAPPMVHTGWGRIINITTSLGTMLRKGYAPYGPTKASAEALSAVMAADLEGSGVTVNVVTPGGVVNTQMIPQEAPFARDELVQPEVMLPPLDWLCSDAADTVTGQRFLGVRWDPRIAPEEAARTAGAPIGWKSIAALPMTPDMKV